MLSEIVVRNGDGGGAMNDVNEPVGGACKVAMINPNVGGTKDGNGVAVGAATAAGMRGSIPHRAGIPGLTIVHTNSMYDYIGHPLNRNARPISNLHFRPSPINGLIAIHHKLILQRNHHIPSKRNPQRRRLNCAVPKRAPLRVPGVIRRVGDHVHVAVLPAGGVFPEPDGAIGQCAAVGGPVRLGAPAGVYDVHGGCLVAGAGAGRDESHDDD